MKRKSYFCLFVGIIWFISAGEVRSRDPRGSSASARGPRDQRLDGGKANAAGFGRVYALVMNLAGKQMFLGTDGGLFRSAGSRGAWRKVPVPAKPSTLDVTAIALDPRKANAMYIATREAGVLASGDGGTTWNQINNGLGGLDAEGLAIDPNDGKLHVLTRGKQQAIYRIANGGNNWERVNGGPGRQINVLTSVNMPTGMGGIFLYAGTADGLYRSPDCF